MQRCPLCMTNVETTSDSSYWDGEGGYLCHSCGDKVIAFWNRLVNGRAGYTTHGEVGVSLAEFVALYRMLVFEFDMQRWVITEERRRAALEGHAIHPVLKGA